MTTDALVAVTGVDRREPAGFRAAAMAILLVMPVHVLLIFALQAQMGWGDQDPPFVLVKMWKEVACVLVTMGVLGWRVLTTARPRYGVLPEDAAVMFALSVGVAYLMVSPRPAIGLWSFRSLYQIYLFYLLGRVLSFTLDDFRRFFKGLLVLAAVLSVFAVVQVEFIGPAFYFVVYGWAELPTALETSLGISRIRATSTLGSVHEFGLFMTISVLIAVWLVSVEESRRARTLLMGTAFLLLIGLYYSFSRSSMALLLVGLLIVGYFSQVRWSYVMPPLLVLVVGLGTLGAEAIRLVVSGGDPSSVGHVDIFLEALRELAEAPLGVGLGTVGVVVRRFIPEAPQYEGELLNLAVQAGVAGLLVYLLPIAMVLFRAWRVRRNRALPAWKRSLSGTVIAITVVLLMREVILPRDAMNYYLGWFLLGLYLTATTRRPTSQGAWPAARILEVRPTVSVTG